MEVLRPGNLLLRFALELCVLAALAYWGATTTLRLPGRIALAIAIPGVVAAVWSLVVAPKARVDLGPVFRLAVEIVIFAAAVTALAVRHQLLLAVLLALLYLLNRVLMAIWRQ
jgi:hypothetical protein